MNYEINEKQHKKQHKKRHNIELVYILCIILSFLLLIHSDSILNINLKDKQASIQILIPSMINYVIAIISSIYYLRLKGNDEIICYLLYFIIAFFINLLVIFPIDGSNIKYYLLFLYLLPINKILLIISILPNIKFENMSDKKKHIFSVKVLLCMIVIYFIEIIIYNNSNLNKKMLLEFLTIYGIFILIFASFINLRKYKVKNNYLNLLLSIVLLSNSIRYIFVLMFALSDFKVNKYSFLPVIFKQIIIPLYSIGILYISNIHINNKLKNVEEIDTFYNILDGQLEKEVYFLTMDYKVIYANKMARSGFKIDDKNKNYIDELSEKYNKISENVNEEKKKFIINYLKKHRTWLGVINLGNNLEKVVEINKYVNEDYGEIIVVIVNSDKETVTLRKELEEKNKLFEILTRKSGDLIGLIDEEYNLKYVNDEVCNVLGYKDGELINTQIGNLFSDAESADFDVKEKTVFELHLKCKDGDIIDVETLVTPTDEGWILSSRNVAYKRQMQLLKEENESIKMHQQLKTDFFANLSHELKTPLNIFSSIIQILDLNLKKDGNEFKYMYEKYNKGLKVNIYRMIRMITNLIDLTKIDSDFAHVKFKNYDIVNLCELITSSIVPYGQQKNISIIFDTEKEEHVVKCDGEFMERIMLNLLSNAIKYTKERGKIFVNLNFDDDYVYIKVKDNGIGIPKEKQVSIFEKFVRVDKSLRRENEGSGIGLSIVKSLVDLMEGSISVKSEENVGSEFTIKLPNKKMDGEVNIYNIDKQNVTLELSDIYEIM